ncbi:hypothetical protein QOZ80_3BG0281690 [Eleusine coracana subsp. coracana]|nr:hypothetical protein QOZ80_3BG0281690 [Eleusine coracana subsp. coracana]
MAAAPHAGPAVRVSSRLQLATTFFPCSSDQGSHRRRRRQGSAAAGPPPAMTADVRVVIRRHFPGITVAGPDGAGGTRTVVQKVAEDIALRRRPSRVLRDPEQVDRALAEDVLPLVRHKFDRDAVVGASKEICAHVSAACADARLAHGGVHVLVLVDTLACLGTVLRRAAVPPPPLCKLMMRIGAAPIKSFAVTKKSSGGIEKESGMVPPPAKKKSSGGVIGDARPKTVEEERFKGWLPW